MKKTSLENQISFVKASSAFEDTKMLKAIAASLEQLKDILEGDFEIPVEDLPSKGRFYDSKMKIVFVNLRKPKHTAVKY